MALIGYARVSTVEQNEARQTALFKEKKVDKFFLDRLSGKNTHRPQLKAMLNYVREGDTVIVSEYSRLARSTRDLLSIVQQLTEKKVQLISDKERLDTSTAQGRLMLTVFAALAEFERDVMLQRQREGIIIAKKQGKYKGRQPILYNEEQFRKECQKWIKGQQTATVTMKLLGMKPNRFYRLAKKHGFSRVNKGTAK